MGFNTKALNNWFALNKRDFPWRNHPTPYQVWVSEVMLQQTRATVVIPYFEAWMKQFPTINDLSCAPFEKVLKAWEGLGYYNRVRNLYFGSKQIVEKFSGSIPSTEKELSQIKGLGPYTIGAILAFGFQKKAVAVDGNVLRALSRFFGIEDPIDREKTKKQITLLAEQNLCSKEPWITSEALIELGATICTKKPLCNLCPLNENCIALNKNLTHCIPTKKQKVIYVSLKRIVLIVEHEGHFLIKKETKGKVMADLYEFPYFPLSTTSPKEEDAKSWLRFHWSLSSRLIRSLPKFSQTFTKYRVQLFPFCLLVSEKKIVKDYDWVPLEKIAQLTFSSGHRKIIKHLFGAA